MYGMSGGLPPSAGSLESQPQQTKSDIKNIIPLDLYEGMEYASVVSARLIFSQIRNGEVSIPPRDVKSFYRSFFKTFWFTRMIISDKLRDEIEIWNREFGRNWRCAATLYQGVNLFIRFYDELAMSGFITYFEGSVQPGFLQYRPITPEEEAEVERRLAADGGV